MALNAGDARKGTGLAGLMASKLKEVEKKFDVKKGYKMCDAFAQAIVEHFESNAEVNVSTPNVQGGADTRAGTGTIT